MINKIDEDQIYSYIDIELERKCDGSVFLLELAAVKVQFNKVIDKMHLKCQRDALWMMFYQCF